MSVLAAASRSLAVALVLAAVDLVAVAFDLTTTGLGFGFAGPFFLPGGAMNPETGMGDKRSEYDDLVLGGISHSMVFFHSR